MRFLETNASSEYLFAGIYPFSNTFFKYILLYINGKINHAIPNVRESAMIIIINQRKSPRNKGTNILKNSVVQEKPSLTSFRALLVECLS